MNLYTDFLRFHIRIKNFEIASSMQVGEDRTTPDQVFGKVILFPHSVHSTIEEPELQENRGLFIAIESNTKYNKIKETQKK